MIDEAIGKVLGMAMAYGASALGMFVAYVNYRRRIVKAETVMTAAAWTVLALSVLAVAGAVLVVVQLAETPAAEGAPTEAAEPVGAITETEAQPPPVAKAPGTAEERDRWTWIGIVVPAAIFLFATVVTAGLHRHFSTQGHGADP